MKTVGLQSINVNSHYIHIRYTRTVTFCHLLFLLHVMSQNVSDAIWQYNCLSRASGGDNEEIYQSCFHEKKKEEITSQLQMCTEMQPPPPVDN